MCGCGYNQLSDHRSSLLVTLGNTKPVQRLPTKHFRRRAMASGVGQKAREVTLLNRPLETQSGGDAKLQLLAQKLQARWQSLARDAIVWAESVSCSRVFCILCPAQRSCLFTPAAHLPLHALFGPFSVQSSGRIKLDARCRSEAN